MKTLDVTFAPNFSPTSTSWNITFWRTHKRRQSVNNVLSLFSPWKVTCKECIVDLVQNMWPAQTVELRWKELENMRKFAGWPMKKKLLIEKIWKPAVKNVPKFWQTSTSWPGIFNLLIAKRGSLSASFVITKSAEVTTWTHMWKITTVKSNKIKGSHEFSSI